MKPEEILIAVPCLNEERHLPRLLEQLLADNPGTTIVVADGGSIDSSRRIVGELRLAHPNLHLLDNPLKIQAAGINLAVRHFGEGRRWLARIDAHCRYPADYVKRLIAAADEHSAASVVVPMLTFGESCFQIAAAAAQNSVLGTGGSPHRHPGHGQFVDHGHHALIAIEAFIRAGGYRMDMAANEDAELDCRLIAQRAAIWLEPSLAIDYFPRPSLRSLVRQYFRYGQGRSRTVRLHRQRLKLRQLLPIFVPITVLLALAAPVAPMMALPLIAWLGLTLGAGFALGIRTRHHCALAAGLAAGAMHFAWGLGFICDRIAPSRMPRVPDWGSWAS